MHLRSTPGRLRKTPVANDENTDSNPSLAILEAKAKATGQTKGRRTPTRRRTPIRGRPVEVGDYELDVVTPSEEQKVDVEIVDVKKNEISEEKEEDKTEKVEGSEELLVFGVTRTATVDLEGKPRSRRSRSPFPVTRRTRSNSKSSTVTPTEATVETNTETQEKDIISDVKDDEVKDVTVSDNVKECDSPNGEVKENVVTEDVQVPKSIAEVSQSAPLEESIVSALKQKEDSVPQCHTLAKSSSTSSFRSHLKGPSEKSWNFVMTFLRGVYVLLLVCGVAYYFAVPRTAVEDGSSE